MAKKELDLNTLTLEVERQGQKIRLPTKPDLSLSQASVLLGRMAQEEEELAYSYETVEGAIPDAALAVGTALKRHFGYVASGRRGAATITVPAGPNPEETVSIPWDQCKIPSLDGRNCYASVTLGVGDAPEGGLALVCKLEGPRKNMQQLQEAITTARKLLLTNSLYRERAISYSGNRDDFNEFRFMDLPGKPPAVILRRETEQEIQALVDTFILEGERYVRQGGSPRRSILLAGSYGTGKTETARRLADLSTRNGQTFFYVENVQELRSLLRVARHYTPCVIFAEDADQIMQEHESLAEALDGIDTKHRRFTLILTTNHPELIHPVYLRPGRLDAVIYFQMPDEEASARLLQHYGATPSEVLDEKHLTEAGEILSGLSPAVIRESVQRARLAALAAKDEEISGESLLIAARSVRNQQERVEAELKPKGGPTFDSMLRELVEGAAREGAELNGQSTNITAAAEYSQKSNMKSGMILQNTERLQRLAERILEEVE